ncbi:MAG: hypothetical protein AB8E15_01190 [Bdellovibrionales bacterium]
MSKPLIPPQAYSSLDLQKAYLWLQNQPETIKDQARSPESLFKLYRKAQQFGAKSIMDSETKSTTEFRNELKNLADQMGDLNDSSGKPNFTSSVKYSDANQDLPPWVKRTLTGKEHLSELNSKATEITAKAHTKLEHDIPVYSPPRMAESKFDPSTIPVAKPEENYQKQQTTAPPSQMEQSYNHEIPNPQPSFATEPNYQLNIPIEPPQQPNYLVPQSQPQAQQRPTQEPLLDDNLQAMVQEIRRKLNLSSDTEAIRMMLSIGYEKIKNIF